SPPARKTPPESQAAARRSAWTAPPVVIPGQLGHGRLIPPFRRPGQRTRAKGESAARRGADNRCRRPRTARARQSPMTRPNLDRLVEGWRGPLLAALVALLAGLPGLLLLPPLDRDEARFAQVTAQMLETGDFIDLRFQDQGHYRKPAGVHWLQAVAVSAVSEVEARDIRPYRLPSLLGAMLAAWACAWGGAALFGARAGFLAGA